VAARKHSKFCENILENVDGKRVAKADLCMIEIAMV
jgi:hypothetical protein